MDEKQQAFLRELSARPEKSEPFGYGIGTAADYVSGWAKCAGDGQCRARFAKELDGINSSWDDLMKAASEKTTYSNDGTVVEKYTGTTSSFKDFLKAPEVVSIPPRTIMVVGVTVTTPQRDRDGDILRSEGALMDPAQPALWQHMHVAPVGKMLEMVEQTEKGVRINSAIIDSELGNDTAQLIEFGALRISHGFLPKTWTALESEEEKGFPFEGFDIQTFEVMEHSFVSVPSNIGGVITAFSRGKLADPTVKSWAKNLFDQRETKNQIRVGAQIGADGSVKLPGITDSGPTVSVTQEPGITLVKMTSGKESSESAELKDEEKDCVCGGSAGAEATQEDGKSLSWEEASELFGAEIAEAETGAVDNLTVEDHTKQIIQKLDSVADIAVIRRLALILNEIADSSEREQGERDLQSFLTGITN